MSRKRRCELEPVEQLLKVAVVGRVDRGEQFFVFISRISAGLLDESEDLTLVRSRVFWSAVRRISGSVAAPAAIWRSKSRTVSRRLAVPRNERLPRPRTCSAAVSTAEVG